MTTKTQQSDTDTDVYCHRACRRWFKILCYTNDSKQNWLQNTDTNAPHAASNSNIYSVCKSNLVDKPHWSKHKYTFHKM